MSRRPPRRRASKVGTHEFAPDGHPHNGVESCRRCGLTENLPNGEPRAAHVPAPVRPVDPAAAELQARILGEATLWDTQ